MALKLLWLISSLANEVQLLANSFPGKLGHSFRTGLSFHFPFSLWAPKPLLCLFLGLTSLVSDFMTCDFFYLQFLLVKLIIQFP